MKSVLACSSLVFLAACVREVPTGMNDPADATARIAPMSEGSGVLLAEFNADTIAPDAAPPSVHDQHQHGVTADDAATSSAYTCPHHPDVVSDKPGTCPKCGMDLVPKKPPSNDSGGQSHEGH